MKLKLNIEIWAATVCLLLLGSCKLREVEVVDFNAASAMNADWFQVSGSQVTSLENGLPDNCYLPDGIAVNDYVEESDTSSLRTNSVSMAGVISNLLAYNRRNQVQEVVGTYKSIGVDGKEIILSGKVLIPLNTKIKRIMVVSHYTICSDAEAPSNSFPLEGVLCPLGYAMIFPDYIGYGITRNQIHPYLAMRLTATNVIDMYKAVAPWLEAAGYAPENKEIYLMGYSQGGSTTMSVQWLLETKHPDIAIRRVFVGGGPYDVMNTYDSYVTSGIASYPVAVPMVLQGMNVSDKCGLDLSKIMQPRIFENINQWINSKQYTTAQINKFIGTKNAKELLTDTGLDRTSKEIALLYKSMKNNSIVNVYDWIPEASVYMLHSMDDETVPFSNAQKAKDAWWLSNIQYNFGHYGKHVNACLRFIYSVQTLLKNE